MKTHLIRHACPIKTREHHATWKINPEDCKNVKGLLKDYDLFFCSPLRRSIETGYALFPDARWIVLPELEEINKPEETQEEFAERVKKGFSKILDLMIGVEDVLISSHSRWMRTLIGDLDKEIPYLGVIEV